MGWGDQVRGKLDVIRLDLNPHAMLVEPFVSKLNNAINARLLA